MTMKVKSGFLWELTLTYNEGDEITHMEFRALDENEVP